MLSKAYHDFPDKKLFCSSCDLYRTLDFSLLGVCKDTFFGKIVSIFVMYAISLYLDAEYMLNEKDNKIKFTGMQSSIWYCREETTI